MFRINVLENPVTTPLWNHWTLEFNGHRALSEDTRYSESSDMFFGLEQWTFSHVQIIPWTTERSTGVKTDVNAGVVENKLTLLFRPHNAVPAPGGLVSIVAPAGFAWLQVGTSNVSSAPQVGMGGDAICNAVLSERPVTLSSAAVIAEAGGSLSVDFWDPLETACTISPLFPTWFVLELVGNKGLTPDKEYAIVVTVKNPETEVVQEAAGQFEMLLR